MICDKCSSTLEERPIYATENGNFCKRCCIIIEKNQTTLNLNKESSK